MKRFFLLEMEFAPDTRLTTDERGFAEVLRTNAEAVAAGFTKGTKPALKILEVPDKSLVIDMFGTVWDIFVQELKGIKLVIISPHDD